ncbi:MAG: hypothetical protein N3F05_02830 [Candidatus Diapherotrites archaeon]|nr:hypothetical protein [Candidatus Diapherotrites archaeon]
MQSLEKEIEELLLSFGINLAIIEKWHIEKAGNSFWLTSKGLKICEGFNMQCKGLRVAEKTKLGWKPTSYFLQFFATYITKKIVEINKNELLSIIKGTPVEKNCENGYVAIRFKGHIVGCGLCKNGKVYSQLPKELAIALSENCR